MSFNVEDPADRQKLRDEILITRPATYAADVALGATQNIADILHLVVPGDTIEVERVTIDEMRNVIDWSEVGTLPKGKFDSLRLMMLAETATPSGIGIRIKGANIRAGLADVFSGPAAANSEAAMIALQNRPARREEFLFGEDTVLTHTHVARALGS